MRKTLLLLVTLLTTIIASSAQQISVESFKRLDNDLDARVTAPVKDQNGDVCAIIKVVTTQTGFTFNVGLMGVISTVQKTGEIWVYVPQKVNRITIAHPKLGVLRDYPLPVSIDAATCYELRLIAGTVTQVVEEDAGGQYFVVHYTPSGVPLNLYVDEEFKATGTDGYVAVMLPYGKHTYRLESIGYNNSAGTMNIGTEKHEINVDMVSSFGYVNIEADVNIKDDIDIYVDGEMVGKAPLKTPALTAGEHTIQALSKYYYPFQTVVNVLDGEQVVDLMVELQPNFAQCSISNPDGDAKIYVNDTYIGSGSADVRLSSGMNLIELRKESHRTVSKTIEAVVGVDQTLTLDAPKPIYGTLQVESTPIGADIYVDGVNVGKTPAIIKNTLIGSREVTLKREGYKDNTTEALVEQSKITTKTVEMAQRTTTKFTVHSTPDGASVYLNGDYVGVTPFVNKELDTGSYSLEVRKDGYVTYSARFEAVEHKAITRKATLNRIASTNETTPAAVVVPTNQTATKKKGLDPKFIMHLTMGFPAKSDIPKLDMGGMLGIVKRVGWYASYSGGLNSETEVDGADQYSERWMINTGIMVRPASWLILYAGAGYGVYDQYVKSSYNFNYTHEAFQKMSYDVGLMFVAKSITFSGGYSAIGDKYGAWSIGIGLAF